jgi:hypothetical protein
MVNNSAKMFENRSQVNLKTNQNERARSLIAQETRPTSSSYNKNSLNRRTVLNDNRPVQVSVKPLDPNNHIQKFAEYQKDSASIIQNAMGDPIHDQNNALWNKKIEKIRSLISVISPFGENLSQKMLPCQQSSYMQEPSKRVKQFTEIFKKEEFLNPKKKYASDKIAIKTAHLLDNSREIELISISDDDNEEEVRNKTAKKQRETQEDSLIIDKNSFDFFMNQIEKAKMASKFLALRTFYEYFDHNSKGNFIKVNSGNSATSCIPGSILLLNSSIVDNRAITFKIVHPYSKDLAIGVCSKSIAEKNNFESFTNSNVNHGCYLVYANGLLQTHRSRNFSSPSKKRFLKIGYDNLVVVRISIQEQMLYVDNLTTSKSVELSLKSVVNWSDLYPCARLPNKGDALEIISPMLYVSNPCLRFTPHQLFAHRYHTDGPFVKTLSNSHSNFVLLNQSVEPGKEYKFKVDLCLSKYMAFGLCLRTLALVKDFECDWNYKNHGGYLISAGNMSLKHGTSNWVQLEGQTTLFESNDVVALTLDYSTFSLILRNVTKRSSSRILIDYYPNNIDDLYPCVLMATFDEKIRLFTE